MRRHPDCQLGPHQETCPVLLLVVLQKVSAMQRRHIVLVSSAGSVKETWPDNISLSLSLKKKQQSRLNITDKLTQGATLSKIFHVHSFWLVYRSLDVNVYHVETLMDHFTDQCTELKKSSDAPSTIT